MTFDEFWKQSGWHSEVDDSGTSEFHLAKDAYQAGQEANRATVAAAMAELRAKIARERSALYGWIVEEINATIAALGLGGTEEAK